MSFLSEHGLSPIRVRDLTQAAALSKHGFILAFSKHTGTKPGRSLRLYRLLHAQSLLLSSNHGLKEISERCGFRCMNTFCVAFKREIGVSPMRFQREVLTGLLAGKFPERPSGLLPLLKNVPMDRSQGRSI